MRTAGIIGTLGTRELAMDSASGVLRRRGGMVRFFDLARAISSSTSLVSVICSPRAGAGAGAASGVGEAPAAAVARAEGFDVERRPGLSWAVRSCSPPLGSPASRDLCGSVGLRASRRLRPRSSVLFWPPTPLNIRWESERPSTSALMAATSRFAIACQPFARGSPWPSRSRRSRGLLAASILLDPAGRDARSRR